MRITFSPGFYAYVGYSFEPWLDDWKDLISSDDNFADVVMSWFTRGAMETQQLRLKRAPEDGDVDCKQQ